MVEGPFRRLIFTHLALLMKQIKPLQRHLLSYVDLLTFKGSRISGLSSMICRAAWHLGKICPLIYGCYENSDLENTDLRPPKNSDPGCLENSELRPSEKLRPMGVSKTQTLNIFQILQLTIVCEQPLSLSQPLKRMVLQKYLLSENSHWQNLDKTKFLI